MSANGVLGKTSGPIREKEPRDLMKLCHDKLFSLNMVRVIITRHKDRRDMWHVREGR
jgi:hypothetical protein